MEDLTMTSADAKDKNQSQSPAMITPLSQVLDLASVPSPNGNENQSLLNLSHAELISQLMISQSKIHYLEGLCQKLAERTIVSEIQNLTLLEPQENKSGVKPAGSSVPPKYQHESDNNRNVAKKVLSELELFRKNVTDKLKGLQQQQHQGNDSPQGTAGTDQEKPVGQNTNLLLESESLPLIPSPYVTTPPYEYIVLTKDNEKKCRIFVNPKIDLVFKEELAKLRREEDNDGENVSTEIPKPGEQESVFAFSEGSKSGSVLPLLPLPHLSSDATIIHCFDPSDVDVELKKIFKASPPLTHKIVRRKSRVARGSSVPAIDSYYGTQDLEKVGHASYFIPDLTPSERKAIGWKDRYTYGRWKYANSSQKNINSNQPHIPLRKSYLSILNLVRKSKSGNKSKTHITTQIAAADTLIETSSNDNKKYFDKPPVEDKQAVFSASTSESCSTISASQSCSCRPSTSRPQKNGKVIKNFIRWFVPCYKSKMQVEFGAASCSSNDACATTLDSIGGHGPSKTPSIPTPPVGELTPDDLIKVVHPPNPKVVETSLSCNQSHTHSHQSHSPLRNKEEEVHHKNNRHGHGHKDRMILGCFHYRPLHKPQDVVGGDVVPSADDSLVSVLFPCTTDETQTKEKKKEPPVTLLKGENMSPHTSSLPSTPGNDRSSKSLQDKGGHQSRTNGESFSSNGNVQQNDNSTSSQQKSEQPQVLASSRNKSHSYNYPSQYKPPVKAHNNNHNKEDNESVRTNSHSIIQSIQTPSIQVSSNSFYTGGNDNADDFSEADYDDNEDDNGDYNSTGYENDFAPCSGRGTGEELVSIFQTIPETRFLDPKDLCLSRYQYAKPLTNFDNSEYGDYNEPYDDDYDDEDNYNDYNEFTLDATEGGYTNANNNNNLEDDDEDDCEAALSLNVSANFGNKKNSISIGSGGSKKTVIKIKDDCKVQ